MLIAGTKPGDRWYREGLLLSEPIDRARIFRQFSGDDALPIRLVEHPKIDSLRSTIVEPDRILTFQVGTLCGQT